MSPYPLLAGRPFPILSLHIPDPLLMGGGLGARLCICVAVGRGGGKGTQHEISPRTCFTLGIRWPAFP